MHVCGCVRARMCAFAHVHVHVRARLCVPATMCACVQSAVGATCVRVYVGVGLQHGAYVLLVGASNLHNLARGARLMMKSSTPH